ncbi:hypothetical protein [Edaphobacter sp.]|uniref:hypothetical protein n=1 Tax=Edaphobacter sp. TaxID=1934404 RepID=UPI002DB9F029|nr:hypothetical protein [Edaphobacter sp.]HEU5341260.1 hypothetical protein [Edaphobacter sp.]
MGSALIRSKAQLEDCEKHLADTACEGSPIEAYLTQYLVVILCADIQQEIYRLVALRTSTLADEGVKAYIAASVVRIVRSVGKSDISKLLAMFGDETKNNFNDQLDDKDVSLYSNAVGDRHDVAHKQGSQITLRELQDAIGAAERILMAVEVALLS